MGVLRRRAKQTELVLIQTSDGTARLRVYPMCRQDARTGKRSTSWWWEIEAPEAIRIDRQLATFPVPAKVG